MASSSSSSSSSSPPAAVMTTDDLPPPPPLLPTEPIEYVKISCGEGATRHTFIVNRAALVKYSNVCSDLLGIGDEADDVQSSFSLIGPPPPSATPPATCSKILPPLPPN